MSAEEKTEEKAPKRGVGTVATEAIRAGKTNEQALEAVQAEFPDAKTSLASINWYRNKLRSDGEDVPTARDLKKAAKAEEAEDAGEADAGEAEEADPLD
ncbi:hypothetical protein [Roseobacter phage RDJL6]|nr:hypothetical protein [Roseobacter phage RDJL6]